MLAIAAIILSAIVGGAVIEQSSREINDLRAHINISGSILPDMSTKAKEIESMALTHGIIQLDISSGGGSIAGGDMIVDAMDKARQDHNTRFICVGDKVVASMAFIIFSLCDERYSTQGTQFLTHYPFHMYQGFMLRVVLTSRDYKKGYESLMSSENKYFPRVRRVFRVNESNWELLNGGGGMLLRPRVVQLIAPGFLDSCINEGHENVPCEVYRPNTMSGY